jgi:hypothetical protein
MTQGDKCLIWLYLSYRVNALSRQSVIALTRYRDNALWGYRDNKIFCLSAFQSQEMALHMIASDAALSER